MSNSEPLLVVDGLGASWGQTPVLTQISFTVHAGEFLVLMGPNGSGKTTLLRCLAGLETPRSGSIRLRGTEITRIPTHRRGIGMLFQEAALFPRRSVWENIAYGPLLQRLPPATIEARVQETVALLHLEALEDRDPATLSGGERQRVALARTLAARPSLVLLDEPFASIDAEIRTVLRTDFRRVLSRLGMAAIHVTHDREEGLYLGDRVAVLLDGALRQLGSSREVFENPSDQSVARFLGYNVITSKGRVFAVHPREVRWSADATQGTPAHVVATGFTGDGFVVELQGDSGERTEMQLTPSEPAPAIGAKVGLTWAHSIPL
ncbi:MAG: ABC transporter ATP-binding protein [Thermoplasmata archaeon]